MNAELPQSAKEADVEEDGYDEFIAAVFEFLAEASAAEAHTEQVTE